MKLIFSLLLLFITARCFSQSAQYTYYFDKDLNTTREENAFFYGTGEPDGNLVKLTLYTNKNRHLIMVEHFTDSTLKVGEGLFQSYFETNAKEMEGNYVKGKEDGVWLTWDRSGHMVDSSYYADGTKTLETDFLYGAGGRLVVKSVHDLKNNTFKQSTFDEKGNLINADTSHEEEDKVFTKTEIEASFPGGAAAWTRYITRAIFTNIDELTDNDYGTCLMRFIVDKQGNISEVQAMTMKDSRLAKIAFKAITLGPKWSPAMVNGRPVKAYRIQPVTLTNPH